jgi:hypothetical protein
LKPIALSTEKQRDRQLVDLFLQTYKQGQYAAHPRKWITHSQRKDVEVIAEGATGERLAVEHTLLESFPRVWEKEKFIKVASQKLREDATLRVPERIIWVFLPADALDRSQQWLWTALDAALACWARTSLAALPTGDSTHRIEIPLPSGASRPLEINTTVHEARGNLLGAVFVHGDPPKNVKPVLPALEKAMREKVPKLIKSDAEKRVLLLELHGMLIRADWVIDQLRADSRSQKLDAVALAYTSGIELADAVYFFVWYPCSNEWDTPWTAPLAPRHL